MRPFSLILILISALTLVSSTPADAGTYAVLKVRKKNLESTRDLIHGASGTIHLSREESFLGFRKTYTLLIEADSRTIESLKESAGAEKVDWISGLILYSTAGSIYENGTDFETEIQVRLEAPSRALAILQDVKTDPWGYLERTNPDRFARHDRPDQIIRTAGAEFWVRTGEKKLVLFSEKF